MNPPQKPPYRHSSMLSLLGFPVHNTYLHTQLMFASMKGLEYLSHQVFVEATLAPENTIIKHFTGKSQ